jgi:hypothetical protein
MSNRIIIAGRPMGVDVFRAGEEIFSPAFTFLALEGKHRLLAYKNGNVKKNRYLFAFPNPFDIR